MENKHTINPLLCDPETGVCEIPGAATTGQQAATPAGEKPVQVTYFTDPICSTCWGIEPQLRKLKLTYGHLVHINYHMGGLLPSWAVYNSGGISGPGDVAHHWDEVSAYYDMPIDGDVWLEDPLSSSFPPSIAFKAAQMQDEEKAVAFLRKSREMLFLQKKNITKWEHVEAAATATGLNPAQLQADIAGKAAVLFQEDLDLARQMSVRGFPSLFFTTRGQEQVFVYGFKPYAVYEQALLKLYPTAVANVVDTSWQKLFGQYNTLTAKEYAVLSGLGRAAAEHELDALHTAGHLNKLDSKNGALWLLH